MNTFELDREKWLKEVAERCNHYTSIIKKDYYVFQNSSNQYNPEIFMIGINPGGNEPNRPTGRKWYELESDPVTLYKKPTWETKKGADNMRSKLRLLFHNEFLFEKLKKVIMINALYFNTKSSNEAYNINNEIKNYCKRKTLEFIEIINPINIVILTTDKKALSNLGVKELVHVGDNVSTGKLGDREVIILPHYQARPPLNYSRENGIKMGNKLLELLK